jgi:tRNA pseudouridine38-40 synthase
MPRYKVTLEYDGRSFAGWQRQAEVMTVQQAIEETILRLDSSLTFVVAAGRTDAGVHATGQVIHFDLEKDFLPDKLQDALNFHVRPHAVSIVDACIVPETFHARFGAVKRSYLYRLMCRRAPAPLLKGYVWRRPYDLDVEAMHRASRYLIGQHDFTTFRATLCQAKSPVRCIDEINFERIDQEIHMTVHARSFLHSQIRSFMGTLERVGAGRWPVEQVKTALEACDRKACGPVAPPWGLYLTNVDYD